MMRTIEYPYKPRPWAMLGGLAFFGVGAAFMAYEAITNERGLRLNGIPLSPRGATIFFAVMAGVCALFVLAGLALVVTGLTSKKCLRLTPTELWLPGHAWSRTYTVVRRAEIVDVAFATVHKQRFLVIQHRGGELTIAESLLPSRAAFEELAQVLGRARTAA